VDVGVTEDDEVGVPVPETVFVLESVSLIVVD
jgi:hypothetical protein